MTVKLVIFDCDGVLVDTEPTTNRVIASDLVKRGLTLSDHDIGELFVGGTIEAVSKRARKMGAAIPNDWVETIYAKMFKELSYGVRVFDEVDVFLDALAAQGIAIAIASNGPLDKMEITLAPSGLKARFGSQIYSGHDYTPKPAPDMILHAMQVAGVTADETVFIDDSATGASAGLAAGVRTFGFDPSRKFTHLGELAVDQVGSMREIAGLIGVAMPALSPEPAAPVATAIPEQPDHFCPGCGVERTFYARYPWHFCVDCCRTAVDGEGRKIHTFNTDLSGGFGFRIEGETQSYSCGGVLAKINHRPVLIRDAYMGGIVAQPWTTSLTAGTPNRTHNSLLPNATKDVLTPIK